MQANDCYSPTQAERGLLIDSYETPSPKKGNYLDRIEMLMDWIQTVQKIAKNGSRENVGRFAQLIETFPPAPETPTEVFDLREKVVSLAFKKQPYAKDLEPAARTALEALQKRHDSLNIDALGICKINMNDLSEFGDEETTLDDAR